MPEKSDYGIEEDICSKLINRSIDYKVKILHITPDLYPDYMEKDTYHVGRLFWETNKLPEAWIKPCNQMNEIWTASAEMKKMIYDSGVNVPVLSFSQAINVQRGYELIEPFMLQHKKDFIFYSIFQWIDRKNPKGLLRAYWKAFEGNNDVTLLLKTYRINYNKNEFNLIKEDIANWKSELGLKHYPKIYLVNKLLTTNEIARLHKTGDCFINPSSGEGWCRPMHEAMLYSNPVISGSNGGITDLLDQEEFETYYKVPSSTKQATQAPWIPWYTSNMKWKEIDEIKLGEAMLQVYEDRKGSAKIAEKAKEWVTDCTSFQEVGIRMKDRLEAIYEKEIDRETR